jgi:hypothetical protein
MKPRRIQLDQLASMAAKAVKHSPWRAKGITLHHTAVPSLAQRPNGFTAKHLENLQHYYLRQLGWSGMPHIFIDDVGDPILMQPLSQRGVHAASFNSSRWGIEVLGWYDKGRDNPHDGRGLTCWSTAVAAAEALAEGLGVDRPKVGKGEIINFHRHDWRTRKSCPGNLVTEAFLQELINAESVLPIEWRLRDRKGNSWPGPIREQGGKVLVRRADVAAEFNAWGRLKDWPLRYVDGTEGYVWVRDVFKIASVDGKARVIVYSGLSS